MTTELKWFVAEAVFQAVVSTGTTDVRPVTEKLLFLVRATDHASASTRAEAVARAKEHSYRNEQGQQVTWTYVQLVELTEMIDQQFEEGTELKSTMTDVGAGSAGEH
jgi:hypothetical protein